MTDADYFATYGQHMYDEKSKELDEAQAEIARLQAEVVEAEQRGYAKAMEAERILYDQSLKIAVKDARNDALDEAANLPGSVLDNNCIPRTRILALKRTTP